MQGTHYTLREALGRRKSYHEGNGFIYVYNAYGYIAYREIARDLYRWVGRTDSVPSGTRKVKAGGG